MLDLNHMTLGPELQLAGLQGSWDFGVERAPLRFTLAALKTETNLLAARPIMTWLTVDRHAAGMHLLVADPLGSGVEHLEVIIARQAGDAVGPGHAHLVLGPGIIRLYLGQGQRP